MGATGSTLASSLSGREISKELLEPALLNLISKNGTVSVPDTFTFETLCSLCADKTDVYLSHEWGKGTAMHHKVADINEMLKERKLITRFDHEHLDENGLSQIKERIDNASCVLVFVTKPYISKVNGHKGGESSKIEFEHALKTKTVEKMIPVVMDSTIRYTPWLGDVGKLKQTVQVDLSGDFDETNISELYGRILAVIGSTLQNLYERCMAFAIGTHQGLPTPPLTEEGDANAGTVTTVAVVDKTTWSPYKVLNGDCLALCFSNDNSKLYACKSDIKVWGVSEGKVLETHENGSKIHSVCVNHDNTLLVTGDDRKCIKVWSLPSWKVVRLIEDLYGPVTSALFNARSTQIVSISCNTSFDVWSVADGSNVVNCNFDVHLPEAVIGALFSPDETKIAVVIRNSSVKIVDAVSGNVLCGIPVKVKTEKSVSFTEAGHLLVADASRTIAVRDIVNGSVLMSYQIPQIGGFDILLSRRGTRVAFCFGADLMFWDCVSGELLQTINVHHKIDGLLCFSPDGSYVAWTSNGGKINLLN